MVCPVCGGYLIGAEDSDLKECDTCDLILGSETEVCVGICSFDGHLKLIMKKDDANFVENVFRIPVDLANRFRKAEFELGMIQTDVWAVHDKCDQAQDIHNHSN